MPIDLDAIEARCAAATPGPLYASENYLIGGWWIQTEDDKRREREHGDFFLKEDAEFFAAARTDVPALVARVRKLEAALADIADTAVGMVHALEVATTEEAPLLVRIVEGRLRGIQRTAEAELTAITEGA